MKVERERAGKIIAFPVAKKGDREMKRKSERKRVFNNFSKAVFRVRGKKWE